MSTNKAPPSFCKPEVQYNFKICIFNVHLNISEGYLSLTQTLEFTLTFTLTVLLWHLLPSRPGEVSSWPGHHISFFSFMENLAAPNDVASSPPDCRAAASKLWPEVVAEEVERRAAGCFGVCRANSQRAKIESVHVSVWEAPLYSQGFSPLMAATISFTVAVIEFY